MIYLDTSAFVKLVWQERESASLRDYLATQRAESHVSSLLLAIEARRAALRGGGMLLPRVDVALDRLGLIDIGHAVVEAASRIPEPHLRSLDAIHLATAIIVADELHAFVTYDKRLASAASASGIPVVAPE